jgi:MFS family permease
MTSQQAAGILGNLDGSMGIAGWRWLFIIEGVITIGVAIAAGFILPDYPATTKWLNEEERNFASWRLMADISESDDTHSRSIWEGVKLCLTDYRLYLFVLTQHMSILSQTFQYFFPSIVQTLGYGEIETLLLTVPGMFLHHPIRPYVPTRLTYSPVWFATFLVSIAVTWSAGTTGDRSIHICVLMLFAVAGNAIVAGTTVVGARYFAMFLVSLSNLKPIPISNNTLTDLPTDANGRRILLPNHRLLGRELLPASSRQTQQRNRHRKLRRQRRFHLRLLHVPFQRRATVHPR